MIDYEEAREIALSHIGPGCGLVETATFEKPYGWYFHYQSKAYLETGDHIQMLYGTSGFIVERENGRVFEFGSAYPLEKWMADYERGFKYERYDLIIVAVHNVRKTIDLLLQLQMRFPEAPSEVDTEGKVTPLYEHSQLKRLLRVLPCAFTNQAFWHRIDVLDEMRASGYCTYELREHRFILLNTR